MHPSSNCDHRLVGPNNSGQATPWHPRVTAYGCYLPVLTRFTGPRRTGPNHQRYLATQSRQPSSPRRGIRPRYSGFRVQGTASSPSSTTKRIVHEDGRSGKNTMAVSHAPSTARMPSQFRKCECHWRCAVAVTLFNRTVHSGQADGIQDRNAWLRSKSPRVTILDTMSLSRLQRKLL